MLFVRGLLAVKIIIIVLGIVIAPPAWTANLIENWDFSKGNSDFSTEFTYSPTNIVDPGTYDIVTDPKNSHWIACSYSDQTGDGNMMALNGHTNNAIDVVWSQEVNVIQGKNYKFSVWISNWNAPPLPELSIEINGVPQVLGYIAPETCGKWENVSFVWNSQNSNVAAIYILNTSHDYNGNDFAIDGIIFEEIPYQLPNLKWPLKRTLNTRSILMNFGESWPFGECPPGVQKKHVGLDVSAQAGEFVYASQSGVVKRAELNSEWGGSVTIEHTNFNPNFTIVYWHVIPSVIAGDLVEKGQRIGEIADLGNNTHFHFGLRMGDYEITSLRGALPQNDCNDDPAFPEYFIDPETINFEYVSFSDIPVGYWAEDYIYTIFNTGITTGCTLSPLRYCPNQTVTRAQMAVFLGRGIHGSSFTPPPASGIFSDVPTSYWAAKWIEQFYSDGITGGCGTSPLKYCPEDPVTRAQMAVFLLRAKHGENYTPPPATGKFSDVPVSHWAADWIEQLSEEGITSGCGTNPLRYCPSDSVTRAQMAVFIVRAFGL